MKKQVTVNLPDIQKAYFIGIGGIGMSAIARYLHSKGILVFGYDKTATVLTRKLEKEGMKIHYDDDVNQIPEGIDLVVYTPAVPESHGELTWFRAAGYPVYKRSQVLGMISKSSKTIAIAGTHGKTTTSSILAHLLHVGGISCTAFLGGIAQNFGSNYVEGKDEWVVVEADEYDRSFLQLHPYYAAILSMDADHLDIYGDGDQMQDGFKAFAKQVVPAGNVFLKEGLFLDDQDSLSFGVDQGTYRAEKVRVEDGSFVFDYKSPHGEMKDIRFTLPGRHNVENATAAIAIAEQLGVKEAAVKRAMASFKGIKRRFEMIFRKNQVVYIDDYAHHPTELQAAIAAARALFPDRKLTGIFQPHLYSRTRDFVTGFAAALDQLDEVLLMDIYPARELPIPGVSSQIVFDLMQLDQKKLVTKTNLLNELGKKQLEVVMTLGAGDIDTFVMPIKEMLNHE